MKKIFITLSATVTFVIAITLAGCNSAEQVKKQMDEQNAKIQTLVDEKLAGLEERVNKECAAKVDSLANVAFNAWKEEQTKVKAPKKGGRKQTAKAKK